MVDTKKIKEINYSLQKMYEKISSDEIDITPEEYIIKEFDKLFLFEIFFRTYLSDNKISEISPKQMLAQEIVDTLIYNKGNITIEELKEIFNVKKVTRTYVKKSEIKDIEEIDDIKVFEVQVNGNEIDLDSNFYENLSKISIEKENKRSIIVKEDGCGNGKRTKKSKKFIFKRND